MTKESDFTVSILDVACQLLLSELEYEDLYIVSMTTGKNDFKKEECREIVKSVYKLLAEAESKKTVAERLELPNFNYFME